MATSACTSKSDFEWVSPTYCLYGVPITVFQLYSFLFNVTFFKDFIYLFLERGEGREKEGEKHQWVVASHMPPTGDLACNPGMCPDWELNQRSFALQACAQSAEPHHPGPNFILFQNYLYCSMSFVLSGKF